MSSSSLSSSDSSSKSVKFPKLGDIIKPRLIEMLSGLTQEPGAPWKVMLLDQNTQRIVSAVCSIDDVFSEGIALLRTIEEERDPYPSMDAIYFISPTRHSIDILIKDFQRSTPLYNDIHLFFSSRLPDPLFKRLVDAEQVAARIKTFTEVNIDFLAIEAQVFHLDAPPALLGGMLSTTQSVSAKVNKIADKLLTVCLTLKEYPAIRFGTTHPISAMLAAALQHKLDLHPAKPPMRLKDGKPVTTLLILDRAIDMIAPVLHEFTYQAMIYDLLRIDPYKHTYVFQDGDEKKEAVLREQDSLYTSIRHLFIFDATKKLDETLEEFKANNKKLLQADKGGKLPANLKALEEVAKKLPQYQESKEKLVLHFELANKAIAAANEIVKSVASVSQDIATEKWLKFSKKALLFNRTVDLLSDPNITTELKMRLLILWTVVQKNDTADKAKLLKIAKLSPKDANVIEILSQFLQNTAVFIRSKAKRKKNKLTSKFKKLNVEEEPFALSRYITAVKEIMTQAANDELPYKLFPYAKSEFAALAAQESQPGATSPAAPRRTHEPVFAKKDSKGASGSVVDAAATGNGRVIVFMVGGMTFSEMRAAYEVTKKTQKQVLIGSTSILTPQLFLESVKSLV